MLSLLKAVSLNVFSSSSETRRLPKIENHLDKQHLNLLKKQHDMVIGVLTKLDLTNIKLLMRESVTFSLTLIHIFYKDTYFKYIEVDFVEFYIHNCTYIIIMLYYIKCKDKVYSSNIYLGVVFESFLGQQPVTKLLSSICGWKIHDLPWLIAKNIHTMANVNIVSFDVLLAPEIRQFERVL